MKIANIVLFVSLVAAGTAAAQTCPSTHYLCGGVVCCPKK